MDQSGAAQPSTLVVADPLDALLTPDERHAVRAAPVRAFAGAVVVLFGLFLIAVGGGRGIERWQQAREDGARLGIAYQVVAHDAPVATPAELSRLLVIWENADRSLTSRGDARDALVGLRSRAGVALAQRIVGLLGEPDYLGVGESATLARTLHTLVTDPRIARAEAFDDARVARVLAFIVQRDTRAVFRLGRREATSAELAEAALTAHALATLVPDSVAGEYQQAAERLGERSVELARMSNALAMAQTAGATTTSTMSSTPDTNLPAGGSSPADTPAARAELARQLSTVLRHTDGPVDSVSAGGAANMSLVLRGRASAAVLAGLLLNATPVRLEVLRAGFRQLEVHATNGVHRVTIATGAEEDADGRRDVPSARVRTR